MVALLEGRQLAKSYKHGGTWVKAFEDVNFAINAGETLGVVGASGSGKSTLARMIVGLQAPDEGQLLWQGQPLTMPRGNVHRRNIGMVFQSPLSSLNPRMLIEDVVAEPLDVQKLVSHGSDRRGRVQEALAEVGLETAVMKLRPHELSGGQQQRVAIARALCTHPRLLVADEPLSALDVSVGAQIANLLMDLQQRLGIAYIFISHDRNMVAHLAHHVLAMDRAPRPLSQVR